MTFRLKPLSKPMKGLSFWIGPFLFNFNFAKTFFWAEDSHNRVRRNVYWFSIHSIQKPTIKNMKLLKLKALCFIFGPFKFMIGYTSHYV